MSSADGILAALEWNWRMVDGTLADLDEAALARQPQPQCNSIAWTLWHMNRVVDTFVNERIASDTSLWLRDGWCEKYGMSDTMGPLQIGSQEENPFLGRELTEQRDYSEEVAEALDSEVQKIVNEQHDRVRNILSIHRLQLDAVAEALLKHETLEDEEFVDIFEGNVGADDLPNPLALQPA